MHAQLVKAANDPTTPTVLREDVLVTLATLERYVPPVEQSDIVQAERAAQSGPEQATQPIARKRRKRSVPAQIQPVATPAQVKEPEHTTPVASPPAGSQLDVQVQVTGPDGQQLAAKTVRELLAGLVGKRLSPLGGIAHDFLLAVQRRDIEHEQFLAAVYAGAPLLENLMAQAGQSLPGVRAGEAVSAWFNGLVRWRS